MTGMTKIFKTLDEQVRILQSKGLIINDEEETKDILLRENYFFISGYRLLFMESITNKMFLPGTTFEELYSMFQFDRRVRNILFKNLLIIENNIKSITAYNLSGKYGIREDEYLDPKNFVNDRKRKKQIDDLLRKMKRQIRVNGNQHQATLHYTKKYGYVPLWIAVKVLSFGIVSELYQILKVEDQENIAKDFGVTRENLIVYLPILANFRNLCAHEDILYENRTQKHIKGTFYHQILNIKKSDEEEYVKGTNDLFALVIIMKRMLSYDEFKNMSLELEKKIENLSYNLHSIMIENILDRMGFPSNYMQLANIERSSIDEK